MIAIRIGAAAGKIMSMDIEKKLREVEARFVRKLPAFDSDLHGREHLREVAMLAGRIAAELGEDVEAALVAGLLHDCGRVDDGGGNRHALDSAVLARPLLKEFFPHLDAERIIDAVARHADGQITEDPLAGALWDADRLTLVRLGRRVRSELLSTEPGKRMARDQRHGGNR